MGIVDELPEHSVPLGDVADDGARLVADAGGDELREPLLAAAEYAYRPVVGIGQLHRQLHDALEHGGQRQLRGQGHAGLEQPGCAILSVHPARM